MEEANILRWLQITWKQDKKKKIICISEYNYEELSLYLCRDWCDREEGVSPQYSGLYAYYIATNTWQQLLADKHSLNAPQPRVSHSMLFHPVRYTLLFLSLSSHVFFVLSFYFSSLYLFNDKLFLHNYLRFSYNARSLLSY